jgi:hypothetical protein
MPSLPVFTVEIAADPSTTNLFVIGTSLVGSATHLLAADPRWSAIPTGDVRQVTTRRGRAREDQNIDAGTMTVVLDGWNGNYDPDNTSSVYQLPTGNYLLRTGLGVRLKVTVAAVDYYLFTGTLESTRADHGRNPTVTWTVVDAIARLGKAAYPPLVQSGGSFTFEGRVAEYLDYAQIPSADRVVSTGTRTFAPNRGGGTALSNLEAVALAEQGRVYADRLNRIVATIQNDDFVKTSTLTFSDAGTAGLVEYDSITVEPGAAQVINDVTVVTTTPEVTPVPTRTPDDVETFYSAQDAASVEKFGKITMNGGQAVPVPLDAGTPPQTLANYLATKSSVPASRLSSLQASATGLTDALTASLAALELGARVTVNRTTADGRALSWSLHVEGIDHDISTTAWTFTLATSPRVAQLVW